MICKQPIYYKIYWKLLHIERSQLKWFGHLCLPCASSERFVKPLGRTRTCWGETMSLGWLGNALASPRLARGGGARGRSGHLCCPHNRDPDKQQKMDGWMNSRSFLKSKINQCFPSELLRNRWFFSYSDVNILKEATQKFWGGLKIYALSCFPEVLKTIAFQVQRYPADLQYIFMFYTQSLQSEPKREVWVTCPSYHIEHAKNTISQP